MKIRVSGERDDPEYLGEDAAMTEKLELDDKTSELLARALKLDAFLPGMTAEDIAKFFPQSGLYAYPKGSHVIEQGRQSRDIFILLSGKVLITQVKGSEKTELGTLGPEDIFGEVALLRVGERVANAVVAEDSRIFRLAFLDVNALLTGNPALGNHLWKLASERHKN